MNNKVYILILLRFISINTFCQENIDSIKNINIEYFHGSWKLYGCEKDVCKDEKALTKIMAEWKIDSTDFQKSPLGWFLDLSFKLPFHTYDYDNDEYNWQVNSGHIAILMNSINCNIADTLKCEGQFYDFSSDEYYDLLLIEENKFYSYSIQDSTIANLNYVFIRNE